jgi:hypothetical protein
VREEHFVFAAEPGDFPLERIRTLLLKLLELASGRALSHRQGINRPIAPTQASKQQNKRTMLSMSKRGVVA